MSEQERVAFPLGMVVYNRLEVERGETPVKPDLWRRLVEARVRAMPAKCNPFAVGGYYAGLPDPKERSGEGADAHEFLVGERVLIKAPPGFTPGDARSSNWRLQYGARPRGIAMTWPPEMDVFVGRVLRIQKTMGDACAIESFWFAPESLEWAD